MKDSNILRSVDGSHKWDKYINAEVQDRLLPHLFYQVGRSFSEYIMGIPIGAGFQMQLPLQFHDGKRIHEVLIQRKMHVNK